MWGGRLGGGFDGGVHVGDRRDDGSLSDRRGRDRGGAPATRGGDRLDVVLDAGGLLGGAVRLLAGLAPDVAAEVRLGPLGVEREVIDRLAGVALMVGALADERLRRCGGPSVAATPLGGCRLT
jgi:hypothetical protein